MKHHGGNGIPAGLEQSLHTDGPCLLPLIHCQQTRRWEEPAGPILPVSWWHRSLWGYWWIITCLCDPRAWSSSCRLWLMARFLGPVGTIGDCRPSAPNVWPQRNEAKLSPKPRNLKQPSPWRSRRQQPPWHSLRRGFVPTVVPRLAGVTCLPRNSSLKPRCSLVISSQENPFLPGSWLLFTSNKPLANRLNFLTPLFSLTDRTPSNRGLKNCFVGN